MMTFIADGKEWSSVHLRDSGYKLEILDALPWCDYRRKKKVGFYTRLVNNTNDTLRLNFSGWFIDAKDDTLRLEKLYDGNGDFPLDTSYTVTFSPRYSNSFYLDFAGNKKHSMRSYNRSLRKDTMFFQVNLIDKSIRVYPMRNHHNGPFIWSRHY